MMIYKEQPGMMIYKEQHLSYITVESSQYCDRRNIVEQSKMLPALIFYKLLVNKAKYK